MQPLTFYCGINEKRWNHHEVAPGGYACISPVYGASEKTRRVNSVRVPKDCKVVQDSGAFSDGPAYRLTFEAALQRQIRHAERYGYAAQITHRASYDLLIDEVWTDGNRNKRRWSETAAIEAVDTTVAAGRYIVGHRNDLGLILSAQGVTAQQYLECVKRVVPMLDNSRDMLGLGGWCIIGKLPAVMLPVFKETVRIVIPWIASQGVQRVHIWGVLYAPALAYLLWYCDQHNIAVSTDSSGPSTRPAFGSWGYADWTDLNYMDKWKDFPNRLESGNQWDMIAELSDALQGKPGVGQPKPPPVYVRGLERARHVEATRQWLSSFRSGPHYQELSNPKQVQLALWAA
jgi:hypothetical protein